MRTPLLRLSPRTVRLLGRLPRLAPWGSLLAGLFSAWSMDRSAERAGLVVASAWAGWLAYWLLLHREQRVGQAPGWPLAVARLLAQSGAQLPLLFVYPFYLRAATASWPHRLFIASLGLAGLTTLWEPLHRRLMRQAAAGPALQALGTFAALNMLWPILGRGNGEGLAVATATTVVVVPLTVGLARGRGRPLAAALWLSLLLALVGAAGRLGPWVPAAPLHLVQVALGTRLVGLELQDASDQFRPVPTQLVCSSRILAPRGLHDRLLHVWSVEGQIVDRIALAVTGSEQGFRTWSIKRSPAALRAGLWRCQIETAAGQVLGAASARIDD